MQSTEEALAKKNSKLHNSADHELLLCRTIYSGVESIHSQLTSPWYPTDNNKGKLVSL